MSEEIEAKISDPAWQDAPTVLKLEMSYRTKARIRILAGEMKISEAEVVRLAVEKLRSVEREKTFVDPGPVSK